MVRLSVKRPELYLSNKLIKKTCRGEVDNSAGYTSRIYCNTIPSLFPLLISILSFHSIGVAI
jgi:hypothetical protein